MNKFMDHNFLLSTETSRRLYHEVAAQQPIFDYHCHLNPREIAEDKRFSNLTEVWLGGDHYKWRAMRSNGIDERYITGDGEAYDKFLAWAKTIPYLVGNPLYHWTHLELQRYFDIHEALNEATAPSIWERANKKLAGDPNLSVTGIFKQFKVYAVGTTDDPADDLAWHKKIAADRATETRVLPSFRPDKALQIEKEGFAEYIKKLGTAAGVTITSLTDLFSALENRIAYFNQQGCKASDHALEYIPYRKAEEGDVNRTFQRVLAGGTADPDSVEAYKTLVLAFLASEYHRWHWVMQLHLASIRNVNSRMFKLLGPDTGYDAVHDHPVTAKLALFLDHLESHGQLPKTVLYSLNPKDYYTLGTVMGAFQGEGIPGKLQLGSAWWFCDHRDGMEEQLKILGNVGLLSRFIGMLTDSRSFLSYPRHEYFRRILCNITGTWAEDGEIPSDPAPLDRLVADISFNNAQRYFGVI